MARRAVADRARWRDFGLEIFTTFAVVQGVVVVLLTPALVGGAIADERRRKTLDYLLTSELSTSVEIVLGKLAARLLQVLVLVALGLPVVSLIGLFGGVDFRAALAQLRRDLDDHLLPGDGLDPGLGVPEAAPGGDLAAVRPGDDLAGRADGPDRRDAVRGPSPGPTIAAWVNPVLQYVAVTSPLYLAILPFRSSGFSGPVEAASWGMGLQVLLRDGLRGPGDPGAPARPGRDVGGDSPLAPVTGSSRSG